MTIRWNIVKERGNLRPRLTVEMKLTDYERQLCVPVVRVDDALPKPPDAGWRHCLPDENERSCESWQASDFHRLQTPHHKDGSCSECYVLPWRADNSYPEVEAAFDLLRERFEQGVREACASAPMDEHGELETSSTTKRQLAPSVAADRILRLAEAG